MIGSEQIRDQKPGKFDEILRYTPGVRRRHLRGRYPQRLVPDPRLQVRRYRPVPRRPAAVLHLLCELEAAAVQPRPRRGPARTVGGAVWRLQPQRHRQRRQQDAAGRADPLSSRPASTISATPISAFDFGDRCDRPRQRQAVLPPGRPGPERRHPGRFHARQQFLHRAVGHLQAGRGHHVHRAGVRRRNDTRGIDFLPDVGTVVNAPFGRIPTSRFAGDPSVDTFRASRRCSATSSSAISPTASPSARTRASRMSTSPMRLVRQRLRDIAAGGISRAAISSRAASPTRRNLDNQLEYRFDTGPIHHTTLFGVDLKHYKIDDYQGFGGAPSLNAGKPGI